MVLLKCKSNGGMYVVFKNIFQKSLNHIRVFWTSLNSIDNQLYEFIEF